MAGSVTLTPDLIRPDLWSWKGAPEVPVLVAASACWDGRQLRAYAWPTQAPSRFCDNGGFVFGRKAGGFPFSLDDYHDWLKVMCPDVAACLDLPCEAEIAADDAEVAGIVKLSLFRMLNTRNVGNDIGVGVALTPWGGDTNPR